MLAGILQLAYESSYFYLYSCFSECDWNDGCEWMTTVLVPICVCHSPVKEHFQH